MTVNFIVLCLLTLTLWIEFSFRIEPWLIHSLWIGIVHGILFDISGWYHCIWWILYTCKVIKGNTCAYLGSLGVACSPILSVSLEEVGCEPVLNLAATPDEAVSIICTVCWQNYTFNLLVRSWCIWAILLSAMVFSRASRRCFSLNLSVGSLTWLTYALRDALSKDIAPGEFRFSNVHANFLLDWALQLMYVTISSDCYIIKRHVSHAWYRCWTIKALVEAEV